jgi:hypothetical protein
MDSSLNPLKLKLIFGMGELFLGVFIPKRSYGVDGEVRISAQNCTIAKKACSGKDGFERVLVPRFAGGAAVII